MHEHWPALLHALMDELDRLRILLWFARAISRHRDAVIINTTFLCHFLLEQLSRIGRIVALQVDDHSDAVILKCPSNLCRRNLATSVNRPGNDLAEILREV